MKLQLETIANEILNNQEVKPNYSNRDFMNALIIFITLYVIANFNINFCVFICKLIILMLIFVYINFKTTKLWKLTFILFIKL